MSVDGRTLAAGATSAIVAGTFLGNEGVMSVRILGISFSTIGITFGTGTAGSGSGIGNDMGVDSGRTVTVHSNSRLPVGLRAVHLVYGPGQQALGHRVGYHPPVMVVGVEIQQRGRQDQVPRRASSAVNEADGGGDGDHSALRSSPLTAQELVAAVPWSAASCGQRRNSQQLGGLH